MKRILSLIILMISIGGISAIAQIDSVKVRLQTSNGAEISLDGDVSSTNILSKLIGTGKHIVTVQYGSDYTKSYEINVEKNGQSEFVFLVDGKLILDSTPKDCEVFVDGFAQGKTPIDINMVGRHNIKVIGNEDLYHPYNCTLEVLPEQNLMHNAMLKKRPPKLYGIVIANYMLSANAPGIMAGIGRRFGGYVKVNFGLNGLPDDSEFHTWNTSVPSGGFTKKPKYFGVNAGLMVHIIPSLFAYAGSGYGEYAHGVYEETFHGAYDYSVENDVYNVSGAELDFGIMYKYKALLLQAGYTRIMAEGDAGSFGSFNIGIGITIHKEKKR